MGEKADEVYILILYAHITVLSTDCIIHERQWAYVVYANVCKGIDPLKISRRRRRSTK